MSTMREVAAIKKPSGFEVVHNILTELEARALLCLLGGFNGSMAELTERLFPDSRPMPWLHDNSNWPEYPRVYNALQRLCGKKMEKVWNSPATHALGEDALRRLTERFSHPNDAIAWLIDWKGKNASRGGRKIGARPDVAADARPAREDPYVLLSRINVQPDLQPPVKGCTHYWVYEAPNPDRLGVSKGTCKRCGGEQYALNFMP